MAKSEEIKYIYTGDASSLKKASIQANSLVSGFKKTVKKTFQSLSGVKLADAFTNSVKEAMNYVENLNMFNVAMGESIETGKKFVGTMSELYGMDPSNIMRYVGGFYQLTSAVNATKESSEVMSMQLTKMANDISSVFNVDTQKVINNLSSGIQGMSRAVTKYGMDIRATTLQVTANSLGISKQVGTMSEANRQGLRYITMMRQAAKVSGDWAKTIESPANQLRIFREQITQVYRAIGNFFLPVLQATLPYINGFTMAIRTMLNYVSALLGISDIDFGGSVSTIKNETDGITSLGNAADATKKKMQDLTAPFDELNVLNEKTSSSSGSDSAGVAMDPKIEEAIKSLQVEFENVRMKANQVRDDILKFFGFEKVDGKLQFIKSSFENNLINKFPQWTATIQAAFDNWSEIINGFKSVWQSVLAVVSQIATDIKNAIINMLGGDEADTKVAQWISALPEKLQGISDWISEHKEEIAKFVEIFAGFKVAVPIIGGVVEKFTKLKDVGVSVAGVFEKIAGSDGITKLKEFFSLISNAKAGNVQALGSIVEGIGSGIKTALGALTSPLGIVIAIASAFALAYATSEDFRKSANELFAALGDVLKTLWDDVIKPIIDTLGPILKDLWYNTILPILEPLMAIIADIAKLAAWLISKIMDVVGPLIPWLVQVVVTPLQKIIAIVGAVIETVVNVVKDVIDAIKALAKGDWAGAWESFKKIGVDILKGLYKIVYNIIGGIWDTIKGFINSIGKAVGKIGGWFGKSGNAAWNVTWSLPSPDDVFMASGGVVSGPTRATIGEGKYDEAVIPLGNSPQIDEMLDKFASKVSDRPVVVKVQIGDSDWDAFTYKSAQRGAQRVGATPLGGGIYV